MNWKGYVQIIPTNDQVKRLEQAINRADEFLKDFDEQEAIVKKHFGRKSPLIIWLWLSQKTWRKVRKVCRSCPCGIGYEVWDNFFYEDLDYDIMKDIQQMIQAGSPLYLDNEMVKVWNKVLTEDV